MKKLIVANWKMNPQSFSAAEKLLRGVLKGLRQIKPKADLVICPPFPWLTDFSHKTKEVTFGAQDVFWKKEGAFTGEVSVLMLKNSKVKYVIIGHSERRYIIGENDDVIAKKIKMAVESGLKVIFCVGEKSRTQVNYQGRLISGVSAALHQQMGAVMRVLKKDTVKELVFAYEPVWAVGTGKPDTPQDALEAVVLIRRMLARKFGNKCAYAARVLYGGSVNPKNIASFISQQGIDGVLVGGASLSARSFVEIVKIVSSV